MTKEHLLSLCASLCLSLGLPVMAQAQSLASLSQGIRKVVSGRSSADSLHFGEQGLLADRIEIKKKVSEQRKLRELELKQELAEEAVTDPSVDLYGEDSWDSPYVNPFAGKSVDIPSTYDIDLGEFVMPINRRQVTSSFGYRRRFGRMHYGTDLSLSIGDTVRSAFSGRVRIVGYEGRGYGKYIVIRHPNGLETVYGHLSRQLVKEGAIVKAGDVVGLGGNTGRSFGAHLHFEARFMGIAINPEDLFDFAQGAPKLDIYTFQRGRARSGGRTTYASSTSVSRAKGKSTASSSIRSHRIKKGETLSAIARRYGTSVSRLRQLNGLSAGATIRAGRSIRVS